MLSNLASYLLGYGDASAASQTEDRSTQLLGGDNNVRLTTVETDEDDWLMVEALNEVVRSRSSSAASLPCLSLEESWFVTPPPCFTSTGPVTVETSPLENLLIEHPSMSVYHRSANGQGIVIRAPPRARSLSPPHPPPTNSTVRPRQRAPLQPHQFQNVQIRAFQAQKLQHLKDSQILKSKQLERSNKVREVNKRNKRQRRADRQKHHSGANNNRKCC